MPEIRVITPADVPALMRLKDAAGWNQTEQDWLNVMRLAPEGCFGIPLGDAVVASATAVCFGRDLAWIGMVLTHPDHRGRGYARALMRHALAYLDARGVRTVKLDATDMGRPLYADLGFVDEGPIERWGAQSAVACQATAVGAREFGRWDRALDRAACGADRTELIRVLSEGDCLFGERGFAMSRPGTRAHYFGPCVASDSETARELLRSCLAAHAGRPVYWDILPANAAAVEMAREHGFAPLRRLVRMRLGSPDFPHDDALVYGIAGFEFG